MWTAQLQATKVNLDEVISKAQNNALDLRKDQVAILEAQLKRPGQPVYSEYWQKAEQYVNEYIARRIMQMFSLDPRRVNIRAYHEKTNDCFGAKGNVRDMLKALGDDIINGKGVKNGTAVDVCQSFVNPLMEKIEILLIQVQEQTPVPSTYGQECSLN